MHNMRDISLLPELEVKEYNDDLFILEAFVREMEYHIANMEYYLEILDTTPKHRAQLDKAVKTMKLFVSRVKHVRSKNEFKYYLKVKDLVSYFDVRAEPPFFEPKLVYPKKKDDMYE